MLFRTFPEDIQLHPPGSDGHLPNAFTPPQGERFMSRKPITYWSINELNTTVARKLEAAEKCRPGPQRQKALREAKRYKNLLETKKLMLGIGESLD